MMQRVLSSVLVSRYCCEVLFWYKQTNPSNEDTPLIRTNCYVPRVSGLAGFHCMYEGQDYKHGFYHGKLLLSHERQPEAASRLSAIHRSYSRNIGAQTANIEFALVSFSCFFWAKKTPHTVSISM